MNPEAWVSVAGIVLTSAVGLITWRIKAEVKTELAAMELRMRDWINGSFLRSKEALVRMEGLERRLDNVEERPSDHARRLN